MTSIQYLEALQNKLQEHYNRLELARALRQACHTAVWPIALRSSLEALQSRKTGES